MKKVKLVYGVHPRKALEFAEKTQSNPAFRCVAHEREENEWLLVVPDNRHSLGAALASGFLGIEHGVVLNLKPTMWALFNTMFGNEPDNWPIDPNVLTPGSMGYIGGGVIRLRPITFKEQDVAERWAELVTEKKLKWNIHI